MHALRRLIPDVEVLINLSPEELGSKILFLLRQIPAQENQGVFTAGGLVGQFDALDPVSQEQYPPNRLPSVRQAFYEAWAWLESQALLIWPDNANGPNGWRRLSRRAVLFEDERQFLAFATGKYLRPEMLHADIARDVWLDFARGAFDVAIFQAMRAVEISVRQKSNAAENEHGVPLMRRAFIVENGPLTDPTEPVPEREALMALFSGAIGRFKNPQSHRLVGVQDAREAMEK